MSPFERRHTNEVCHILGSRLGPIRKPSYLDAKLKTLNSNPQNPTPKTLNIRPRFLPYSKRLGVKGLGTAA